MIYVKLLMSTSFHETNLGPHDYYCREVLDVGTIVCLIDRGKRPNGSEWVLLEDERGWRARALPNDVKNLSPLEQLARAAGKEGGDD